MTHDLRDMIIAYRLHTCWTNKEYKVFDPQCFSYSKIRLGLVKHRASWVSVCDPLTQSIMFQEQFQYILILNL